MTISWSSSLLPVRVALSFDIQGESPSISFRQAPKCRHCGPSNPVLNDIGVLPCRPWRRLNYELRGAWRERLGKRGHPATGNSMAEAALLLVEFAAVLQILVGLSKRREFFRANRADFRVQQNGGKPSFRRRWLRVARNINGHQTDNDKQHCRTCKDPRRSEPRMLSADHRSYRCLFSLTANRGSC